MHVVSNCGFFEAKAFEDSWAEPTRNLVGFLHQIAPQLYPHGRYCPQGLLLLLPLLLPLLLLPLLLLPLLLLPLLLMLLLLRRFPVSSSGGRASSSYSSSVIFDVLGVR
jgi:hypothetical protein